MAPGVRSSFSMAVHKGRAFLFGGASDNEAKVRFMSRTSFMLCLW